MDKICKRKPPGFNTLRRRTWGKLSKYEEKKEKMGN